MQQCPDCGRVYDESEYSGCPNCDSSQYSYSGKGNGRRRRPFTPELNVIDKKTGEYRKATDEEYEQHFGFSRYY